MVTYIILLAGFEAKSKIGCRTVALLLHYFVLSSFCWMAVEAFVLYRYVVTFTGVRIENFVLKSSVFGLGEFCYITIHKYLTGYNIPLLHYPSLIRPYISLPTIFQ